MHRREPRRPHTLLVVSVILAGACALFAPGSVIAASGSAAAAPDGDRGHPAEPRARQVDLADADPGTLRSEDLAGLRLRAIGPAAMSGRMVDIAVVESDPYVFYVASATGGLWKTTNNGVTYKPVFEREASHSIGDVAVHQGNPDIVWVGTGERANRQSSSWGDGVYKSVDAGETWTNVGLRDSHHIGRIVLHPTDSDLVYVAAMGHLWGANEERGLYRTTDGGSIWERILQIDEDTGAVDVAIDPSDPTTLYAAMYQRRRTAFGFHGGGPGSSLWRSTDSGDTWVELTARPADPATEEDPEVVAEEDAEVVADEDAEEDADHPEGVLANGLPAGEYGRIGISIHRADPRIVYVTIEQGLEYTASTSYDRRLSGIYRSEDRGETWRHMGTWNPRPMYASQILVDPSDDQRVYQQNAFSWSDDGGATFTVPRQSIHSDDRFLWVDPNDSRHLIKASDGALGISYDRGTTWLYAGHLPVSQYYRVGVDMRDPYHVYGGLQDNGSWVGPNETYRSEGIVNEDWISIGGGDGFMTLADPTDEDTIYVESQYLGLTHLDLETLERRSIRPGNPEGYKAGRRDWKYFGTGDEPDVLEQPYQPGNWDGAYILSPHDPNTLWAGTENLYVSRDRGTSWTDLGRMSSAWERSEVSVMGQQPVATTESLDDGVPYFATVTTIAESPLQPGLLYVGTDDGNVQISENGGDTWRNVADRFPGLPPRTWVADLEPSPHDADTLFAAFDGHRGDDFTNYLFRSNDRGTTWTAIVGDLPDDRVIRAVQQDVVSPDLLYTATEFGFFVSFDRGERWVELKNNMPTLPINDFVIHPRDQDLVLGTHGRGIWILDDVGSLRELTSEVVTGDAALFSIGDARMTRRSRVLARAGDAMFYGENPPIGAIVDYWLARGAPPQDEEPDPDTEAEAPEPADAAAEEEDASRQETAAIDEDEEAAGSESAGGSEDAEPVDTGPEVEILVLDGSGEVVRELEAARARGVNRIIWDLRHEPLPVPATIEEPADPERADLEERSAPTSGPAGPLVLPGTYRVRLTVDGVIFEQPVVVEEDPRIHLDAPARRAWTRLQLDLGELYMSANDLAGTMIEREKELLGERAEGGDADEAVTEGTPADKVSAEVPGPLADTRGLRELCEELRSRAGRLYREVGNWTGPPTADQLSHLGYLREAGVELRARWSSLSEG